MIGSHSLKTEALEKIQNMLFRGEYKQGELFSENDLAKKLSISRTPIREALSEMERDGLVVKIPQVGVRVVEFSDDELREIYEAREMLEGRCAELLAPQITREQIQILRQFISEMKEAAATIDIQRFLTNDLEFHWQIGAFANRPLYRNWLHQIGNRVRIEGHVSSPSKDSMLIVVDEHRAILEALSEHDPEGARAAALRHIENTKERINSNGKRIIFMI